MTWLLRLKVCVCLLALCDGWFLKTSVCWWSVCLHPWSPLLVITHCAYFLSSRQTSSSFSNTSLSPSLIPSTDISFLPVFLLSASYPPSTSHTRDSACKIRPRKKSFGFFYETGLTTSYSSPCHS